MAANLCVWRVGECCEFYARAFESNIRCLRNWRLRQKRNRTSASRIRRLIHGGHTCGTSGGNCKNLVKCGGASAMRVKWEEVTTRRRIGGGLLQGGPPFRGARAKRALRFETTRAKSRSKRRPPPRMHTHVFHWNRRGTRPVPNSWVSLSGNSSICR